jgi:RNA polymerase sigma factor (sigma-70 family)
VPGNKRLTDEQLVIAIKNGDKDAMIQLYKDSYMAVRSYVLKNSGNQDDAEDILQDATIVVWEKIQQGTLELTAKLSTFIFAISRNLWLKRLGKLGRQVNMDGIKTENLSEKTDDFDQQDRKLVTAMLDQMGGKCRELLLHFYFEGLDMASIAEKLGYNNADTVKAKKHQCFKQLQEQFLKVYKKQDFIGN